MQEHPRTPLGTPAFFLCSIRVRKRLFPPSYVEEYLVLRRVFFKVVPLDGQYQDFLEISVGFGAPYIGNAGEQAAVERSLAVML